MVTENRSVFPVHRVDHLLVGDSTWRVSVERVYDEAAEDCQRKPHHLVLQSHYVPWQGNPIAHEKSLIRR